MFPGLWAFFEQMRLLTQVSSTLVQSAHRAQVDAPEEPLVSPPLFTVGGVPSVFCVSLRGWTVWTRSAWQAERVKS